ncbi:MAG: glutamine-hydrolyzing carbamoyl-phosphate synthase small subunit [Vallitaleaceae bacterium]|jgi:carbamoyl-phosphate synthase small subunit|nr:glutamine-hydrolyzing carbamoyl-phosphate synthase small subunit [Vallitaleaceae bacterium]
MKAYIILEDGSIFEGESFGSDKTTYGEIVFNTSMTGYQEILTDPSYAGQIVTMTYPLIGNYGINDTDFESDKVHLSGFIVKEYAVVPNHWQSVKTIDAYLKENDIPGIYGIDTRMITKKIRTKGAMNGIITTEQPSEALIESIKKYTFPADIVARISVKESVHYEGTGPKVALIDLGLKKGIVKQLRHLGLDVTVLPHNISAEVLLSDAYDIIFYSNGPGDPKDAAEAIASAKAIIGRKPIWGICLGHQILALALGADTYKLKFGHRGANHPVIELESGKVFMSSQNHGYAVDKDTIPENMAITFMNVNDDTVEGICSNDYPITSVQFHPEEGPGPEDAHYIFKKWYDSYTNTIER